MNYNELTFCIENSVDPDKPADLDLHSFQEKPADQDPYCLQELIYIWFHTVFERIICLFVCFVALRPKSTAKVIAGRSIHLTTLFPGQA